MIISTHTVIVFLKGTSCAGKTSMSAALKAHGWSTLDDDDFFYEQGPLHWKSLFPKAFETIEQAIDAPNVFHAIVCNQVMFKHSATEELRDNTLAHIEHIHSTLNQPTEENKQIKKEWLNRVRRKIIDAIELCAQQGNVIVDTWFLSPQDMDDISQRFSTTTVLAYAPLLDLIHRTIQRNANAILNGSHIYSMRFFRQALMSFVSHFEFSDNPKGAIDTITKADMLHAFDIVKLFLSNAPDSVGAAQLHTRGEFSRASFKEYADQLLSRFGAHDVLYIIPKLQYSQLIRSDVCTSEEAAQQIIQLL